MAAKTVDLFAGLRKVKSSATTRGSSIAVNKMTIEFSGPPANVVIDPDATAETVALAIVQHVKGSLLAGRMPDGSQVPPHAPGTVERRKDRLAQARRGGAPAKRYKDRQFRANARKRFAGRFNAQRAGRFMPTGLLPTWGVESGMLVHTLVAERLKSGGVRIFTANARGVADRSGRAAMSRVFGRMGFLSAVRSPMAREALKAALRASLPGTKVGLGALLRQVQKTAATAGRLVEQAGP